MVVGDLGGKTANSVLRFGCLVQQPVNFGGLPLQTAAIDMVGGGLGRQTTKKHGLAPRPPNCHGLAPQTTKAARSAMPGNNWSE